MFFFEQSLIPVSPTLHKMSGAGGRAVGILFGFLIFFFSLNEKGFLVGIYFFSPLLLSP